MGNKPVDSVPVRYGQPSKRDMEVVVTQLDTEEI